MSDATKALNPAPIPNPEAAERGRGPSTTPFDNRAGDGWSISSWCALALILVCGLPTLMYHLYTDQGMFSYIGRDLAEGKLLYHASWDIKPPGIFAVYALGWLFSDNFELAPRVLDLIAQLITGYCLIQYCRNVGKAKAGPYAAGAYAFLYFLQFNFANTAQAESFAAPFIALSVLLVSGPNVRPSRALWSGMCIGAAVLLKTSLFAFALAPVWILFMGPARWRGLARFGAGALLPPALTVACFGLAGGIGELLTVFRAQAFYARASEGLGVARLVATAPTLFEFYPYTYGCTALLALGMMGIGSVRRNPVIWCWSAAFWIQIAIQNKYMDYHFIPWILPLALSFGLVVSDVRARIGSLRSDEFRRLSQFAFSAFLSLGFLLEIRYFVLPFLVLNGAMSQGRYDKFSVYNYYSFEDSQSAARAVRAITAERDRILVYAFNPTVYLLAGRRAVTRHISNAPIRLKGWFPDDMREEFFSELKVDTIRLKPKVLVTDFTMEWGFSDLNELPPKHATFCGLPYVFVSKHGALSIYRLDSSPREGTDDRT